MFTPLPPTVAFRIYDMDKDGYISNGELFQVLKMMVGNNLKDTQLQQIVDKTIINADKDGDGRISFEEFCAVSGSPPRVFLGWGGVDISAEAACCGEDKCQGGRNPWKLLFVLGSTALGFSFTLPVEIW